MFVLIFAIMVVQVRLHTDIDDWLGIRDLQCRRFIVSFHAAPPPIQAIFLPRSRFGFLSLASLRCVFASVTASWQYSPGCGDDYDGCTHISKKA